MVQKKARSSYLLSEIRGFFWTIWSNQKSKDIFDAKMAYGQQHFLVWFFTQSTPSHTSFSDSSLSVARNRFIQRNGKRVFQILNMLIVGSFCFPGQKILVGQRRAHAFWAHDIRVLENQVFAHFGAEKFWNSKFFFSSNQPFCRANWWYL